MLVQPGGESIIIGGSRNAKKMRHQKSANVSRFDDLPEMTKGKDRETTSGRLMKKPMAIVIIATIVRYPIIPLATQTMQRTNVTPTKPMAAIT